MKRISILTVFLLALLISIAIPTASRADSRGRKEAMRHCKQEYNESMERARHMRGRERREAVERAKRNRDRCMNEGRR